MASIARADPSSTGAVAWATGRRGSGLASAALGPCLADQLVVPFAPAGADRYRTLQPTLHTLTNIEVVGKLLDVDVTVEPEPRGSWVVAIGSRAKSRP